MGEKITPRQAVLNTPPAHHGALDYAEIDRLEFVPDDILDFSSNINPYGPASSAVEAIKRTVLERYPDREAVALRSALADHLSLSIEQIVVGNGTAELIWLIAFAFVRPGDLILVLGPTFGEYARCARLTEGHVEVISGHGDDDFTIDPHTVERTLRDRRPRLIFICNPNNPTGSIIERESIGRWADDHPETLFIIDEAYLAFASDYSSVIDLCRGNILTLRSMTKDHALAGLRLGYAAGPLSLIEAVARVRPPWNVNAMAQSAGLAALNEPDHLQRTLDKIRGAKGELIAELCRLGLTPLPSVTQYFIVDVGCGAEFRRHLLKHFRIQVRDCASFGLPAYIRIATRRPKENARLLDSLARLLS